MKQPGVQPELNVRYFDDVRYFYPWRLPEEGSRRFSGTLVLLESLRAIDLKVNGSKCELCNKARNTLLETRLASEINIKCILCQMQEMAGQNFDYIKIVIKHLFFHVI